MLLIFALRISQSRGGLQSITNSHTQTHTHTHTHTHSHLHSHTHSLKHTHAHTHSHPHSQTSTLSLTHNSIIASSTVIPDRLVAWCVSCSMHASGIDSTHILWRACFAKAQCVYARCRAVNPFSDQNRINTCALHCARTGTLAPANPPC